MDTKRRGVSNAIVFLVVAASLISMAGATSSCPAAAAWPVTCTCSNGEKDVVYDTEGLRQAREDPTSCCYKQYSDWILPKVWSVGATPMTYSLLDRWKAKIANPSATPVTVHPTSSWRPSSFIVYGMDTPSFELPSTIVYGTTRPPYEPTPIIPVTNTTNNTKMVIDTTPFTIRYIPDIRSPKA